MGQQNKGGGGGSVGGGAVEGTRVGFRRFGPLTLQRGVE